MWLFFDESGDFAFPDEGFDCYVQAGVICPDSRLEALTEGVERQCADVGVAELHGTALSIDQLVAICRFLSEQEVRLTALATDTAIMGNAAIRDHRLDQAARIKENLADFKQRGGESDEIEEWMRRTMVRAGLPQRISNSEYVQADLLMTLIHQALHTSILAHYDDRWRDDLIEFRFILDGKLPNKLAAGEKFLNEVIGIALAYDERFALGEPDWWPNDPVHPFHEKFSTETGLDLRLIFEHGLAFADSRKHPGIQLADVVAHVARRVVLEPQDDQLRTAYSLLRRRLVPWEDKAVRIVGYRGGDRGADLSHYAHVL